MRSSVVAPPRFDLALAVALLLVKVATLATGLQPGSGAISYVAALGITLPLAWRSVHPLGTAVVVSGSQVAEVALGGFHDSLVSLAAWLVVTYSLGAHAADTARLVSGFLVTAAAGGWVARSSGPVTFWNTVAVSAALVAPLLAGLWVRQLRLRTSTLEELAARLAAERDERARAAVAEERARIARELHDEVAHAMSVIAVQADAAEGALTHDPELVRSPLLAIRQTARGALGDMRRVLGALGSDEPASRSPDPSLSRLPELVEQAGAVGLQVVVRTEGDVVPLPSAVDAAAFRIVQEGLTNVRKHAAATRVEIGVRYCPGAVVVEVCDDGAGDRAGEGTGRGLIGIRERVGLLGGELVAERRRSGYLLRATLPHS